MAHGEMNADRSKHFPLVSIIVRTKDRPTLLRNALKSIAAQNYRPIEVVLVNDGGCELPMEELKGILGNVALNYLRLEQNTGRAHAGNVGIENAKGEYVGFLDDDDELYPEHVSTLADFLGSNDYSVAYTDSEIVEFCYDKKEQDYVVKDKYVLFSEDFSPHRLLLGNYIPLMCLLFHREILHDVRFDESFDLYEDWDLLVRLALRHTFSHIKKVTAGYNQNLVRQITSESSSYREAFVNLMQKHMKEITTDVLFYNWRMIIDGRELVKGSGESRENARVLKRMMERKTIRIEEQAKLIEEQQRLIEEQQRLIEEQQRLIEEQQRRVADLHILVNNMKTTLGWQMLESFRSFRDRLLPFGSKRRAYFELFVKSVKVLRTQGFNAFYYKARTKLQGSRHMNSRMARGARIGSGKAFLGKPVDIVLPVYNAYEDLRACLTSVLRATDLTKHRLIVVNDRSTDPRVGEYLDTLSGQSNGRQMIVLKNERNLGFTQTVNGGMQFSERDVILLNSDTIVTHGWVENLREAAYSGPKVATVTPFSNNATICSIPLFCENNALPTPFALDSFAEFIHRISLRYYPEIPTGVGFCMFIKRDVLNEIGYFDEASFERGYGEENDFCMRVIKNGYVNVLDDATYIYHRGGASFTSEVKTAGEHEALRILDRIHPEYRPMVHKFIQENPLQEIHNYIGMRIELERKKKDMSVCRTGPRET